MWKALRFAIDLLYPKICAHCGDGFREGLANVLCAECFDAAPWFRDPACGRCGVGLPEGAFPAPTEGARCAECGDSPSFLSRTLAAGSYTGALRAAHHAYKFEGFEGLAVPLADRMARRVENLAKGWDLIVPIPARPSQVRERGFAPVGRLAALLSRRWGIPMAEDRLVKVRSTRPQRELSGEERRRNLRGAYAVRRRISAGIRVLLVDDVTTTGATLEEAAGALLAGGAKRVEALVLARTPRNATDRIL